MAETGDPARYLILCVDRDDDLGSKARVQTPVTGREAVLAAATKLALADPEEADSNAIFSAVKKLDELKRQGKDCEVAVVCGDTDRGFEADRTVSREVEAVLKTGRFDGIVFISDGGDDEQVIPVLQGLRPIVSVQRVAVKHSQTVEETYQVLGRYLRVLVFDPHYSRWSLGVPGLILIIAGILIISHLVFEAYLVTLLILGGAFIIRGFSIDRTVAGLLRRGPYGYIRLFSMGMSVLIILVGAFTGNGVMLRQDPSDVARVASNPEELLSVGAKLAGFFISGSLVLVWAGVGVYSTGALLSHLARDSIRWRRDGLVLLMLAISYIPVLTFSEYLISGTAESSYSLISVVLVALAVVFLLTTALYPRIRTRSSVEPV
ncbi:MAG: DUF373 family protein [Thaumarchaeota archaeon]|nr:DUF373 family protein [Nitrososphaerota archaeon]